MRPVLLDLFCGAGGAASGYERAGFEVVGVDIKPQPRYPFEFHQGDALDALDVLAHQRPLRGTRYQWLEGFDAIHASPVCKLHSVATPAWARANHPNQIPPTRARLLESGIPWVIENVPGAPLRPDFKICGCMSGLPELKRERWFETSWQGFDLRPPCHHKPNSIITVAGHGEPSGPRLAKNIVARTEDWRRAMGIDWMTRDELAQAIPPAYTEYIGRQLMTVLEAAA